MNLIRKALHMKLSTRRRFPSVILGSFLAVMLAMGVMCAVGCQPGYFDRNNTEAVQRAEERAAQAEKALTVIVAQKGAVDQALTLAQVGLEAAKAAKMDADKIAAAEKAVAFANEKKAQVFQLAANMEAAVSSARAAAETAKAAGNSQSAAEHDAAVFSGIVSSIGSLFGPAGALGGTALGGIAVLFARAKSKQVTAAKKVIKAINAEKERSTGGEGAVAFNDPEAKKRLDKAMGADGKKFVDEVQGS